MKFTNKYIFYCTGKIKHHKQANGTLTFDIPTPPLKFLEDALGVAIPDHADYQREWKDKIVFGHISRTVSFSYYSIGKSSKCLEISIDEPADIDSVNTLESIHSKLEQEYTRYQKDFILATLYDDVSRYYCDRLYPLLDEFDRKLRELLYIVYVHSFGENYYLASTNPELQGKIKKGTSQVCHDNIQKEIARFQKAFEILDYGDIRTLLFTPHVLDGDREKVEKVLNETEDLSKVGDKTLRDNFDLLRPQSDWERLFHSYKQLDNFENDFGNIHAHRNIIAHCRQMHREQYDSARDQLLKATKEIDAALDTIHTEYGTAAMTEAIAEAFCSLSEVLQDSLSRAIKSMLKTMQESLSDSFADICKLSINSMHLNK